MTAPALALTPSQSEVKAQTFARIACAVVFVIRPVLAFCAGSTAAASSRSFFMNEKISSREYSSLGFVFGSSFSVKYGMRLKMRIRSK